MRAVWRLPNGSSRAYATVQNRPVSCRMIASFSMVRTLLGSRSCMAAVRMVCRDSPVSAAASAPFPHTSPMMMAQSPSAVSNTS